MSRSDKWRRQVEQAALGELPQRHWPELASRLRSDAGLRRQYDQAVSALRVLEGDPAVAQFEIDWVGAWLVADIEGEAAEVASSAGWVATWRTWFSLGLAATAAVLVAVLGGITAPPPQDDYRGVKGSSQRRPLAIDVLCGSEDVVALVGGDALVSAEASGCAATDTLAFSYRVRGTQGGVLSLFGIDGEGDPMYYFPTPDDSTTIMVKPGEWRAVGVGVHLQTNHSPGVTRVFGLLSTEPPTTAQIDAIAAALTEAGPATDAAPWTTRIDRSLWTPLCPLDATGCHGVEVAFQIRRSARSTPARTQEDNP